MVYQVIAFDEAVRASGFSLKGTMSQQQEEWDGLCDVILNNAEWFEAWLEGEKKCQFSQQISCIRNMLTTTLNSRLRAVRRDRRSS